MVGGVASYLYLVLQHVVIRVTMYACWTLRMVCEHRFLSLDIVIPTFTALVLQCFGCIVAVATPFAFFPAFLVRTGICSFGVSMPLKSRHFRGLVPPGLWTLNCIMLCRPSPVSLKTRCRGKAQWRNESVIRLMFLGYDTSPSRQCQFRQPAYSTAFEADSSLGSVNLVACHCPFHLQCAISSSVFARLVRNVEVLHIGASGLTSRLFGSLTSCIRRELVARLVVRAVCSQNRPGKPRLLSRSLRRFGMMLARRRCCIGICFRRSNW